MTNATKKNDRSQKGYLVKIAVGVGSTEYIWEAYMLEYGKALLCHPDSGDILFSDFTELLDCVEEIAKEDNKDILFIYSGNFVSEFHEEDFDCVETWE